MIERKYDPTLPYRHISYGRMSDPKRQNRRSPDQQFNTIEEICRRAGYPWQRVKTYRDDGITGRRVASRPGLQQMLRDIELGITIADLVTVDNYERLGRADEISMIRHRLATDHGILLVAADNGFADPTGIVGKAVGVIEQVRATEHSRITAHNVIRGKKDAVELNRWPGGPPPFGFALKPLIDESGTTPKVYHILDPVLKEIAAQRMAFERADSTGEGDTRLARWWNANPEIPDEFKPISPTTMGDRLSNEIYISTYKWGKNRTGIVNEVRVIEPNPDGPKVKHNFCEAVIPVELFERVQRMRKVRSDRILTSRKGDEQDQKLIAPLGRGLTLKYPLTGLVRCQWCKSSMRPTPSGRASKSGNRYIYYSCARFNDGSCPNGHYFSEPALCEAVFARLRARLFTVGNDECTPLWYPDFEQMLRRGIQRFRDQEPDRIANVGADVDELDRQLSGWRITLGDPSLSSSVRTDLVAEYEKAKLRKQKLEQDAQAERALESHVAGMLSPQVVIRELQKLNDVMATYNPTLASIELSKHIEKIVCFPDGKIEMRGTMLGLFDGAVDLLRRTDAEAPAAPVPGAATSTKPVKPRRRSRLYVPNLSAASASLFGNTDTGLDHDRFVGLPEEFFWTEAFVLPRKMSWAEEHAAEVALHRAAGETHEQLAARFGKTTPTIRNALRYAKRDDVSLGQLPRKMPRSRWAEDHAADVARIKTERGLNTAQLAEHFGKSDTTIRAALKHAECRQRDTQSVSSEPARVEPPSDSAEA